MKKNAELANPRKTTQSPPVELIRVDRMYESLRYNDFSAQNGLGEIVDNSVEAGAANIELRLTEEKVRKPGNQRASNQITEIAVIDDGCGMDVDILHKCLTLGESIRPVSAQKGIGRFGVGMTLGSISLARRVEVYSRTQGNEDFHYTFIDLDDIQQGNPLYIPTPVAQNPPSAYAAILEDTRGTIVILKKCDRINDDIAGFSNYLGRTYRKFIERGLKIKLNGEPVYLHDPLYISGPTVFDEQSLRDSGVMEPKATLLGETRLSLEIPDSDGKKADVVIRMSLLPKEWRTVAGVGGGQDAKKRKIDQNEGISILRADREVLYGHVPFIIGKKGEARSLDIDRWWGCEISFPPELDNYFQVRYIKRGAEPVTFLRDQIRDVITKAVETAREIIRQDWAKKTTEEEAKAGDFGKAETAMAQADRVLPKGKKGKNLTRAEEESALGALASATLGEERNDPEKKARKIEDIRNKPYSIEPVSYPPTVLFEPVHLLNNTVIKLNVNHPFYKEVFYPLCGDLEETAEESSIAQQQQRQDIKNAILLLLFSYAKAESMFDQNEALFDNLRSMWGSSLATALQQYAQEAKPNS